MIAEITAERGVPRFMNRSAKLLDGETKLIDRAGESRA
jgi:hypothetical protein